MPLYSLKLSIYDPEIIDSFERLRKSRKQAAFTHEAVKHFLLTDKGKQVLMFMEGITSGQPLAVVSMPADSSSIEKPAERIVSKNDSVNVQHSDSSSVLDRILV